MTPIQTHALITLDPAALLAEIGAGLELDAAPRGRRPARRPAPESSGPTNVHAIMDRAPIDISTMSVEDILFWLMISITDAYNSHIQAKANDVQSAQGQLDTAVGAPEPERQRLQSSLDQETQALQRLLTKRDQFVTMFQQLLKKYDESVAKVWQ